MVNIWKTNQDPKTKTKKKTTQKQQSSRPWFISKIIGKVNKLVNKILISFSRVFNNLLN